MEIRSIRINQDLSLKEVSIKSGLEIQHVLDIENGLLDETVEVIVALAAAMGVHPKSFFSVELM